MRSKLSPNDSSSQSYLLNGIFNQAGRRRMDGGLKGGGCCVSKPTDDPMVRAISAGSLDQVRSVVASGYKVNKKVGGRTAIAYAVDEDQVEIVDYLAGEASANLLQEGRVLPLYHRCKSVRMVELLHNHGLDVDVVVHEIFRGKDIDVQFGLYTGEINRFVSALCYQSIVNFPASYEIMERLISYGATPHPKCDIDSMPKAFGTFELRPAQFYSSLYVLLRYCIEAGFSEASRGWNELIDLKLRKAMLLIDAGASLDEQAYIPFQSSAQATVNFGLSGEERTVRNLITKMLEWVGDNTGPFCFLRYSGMMMDIIDKECCRRKRAIFSNKVRMRFKRVIVKDAEIILDNSQLESMLDFLNDVIMDIEMDEYYFTKQNELTRELNEQLGLFFDDLTRSVEQRDLEDNAFRDCIENWMQANPVPDVSPAQVSASGAAGPSTASRVAVAAAKSGGRTAAGAILRALI